MKTKAKAVLFISFLLFACGKSPDPREAIRPVGSVRVQPFCGNRDIESEGIRLDIRWRRQECDNWCWAATIVMAADYYGHEVKECSLASLRLDNLFQCCVDPICGARPCDEPANYGEVAEMLQESSGLHSSFYPRPLTEDKLKLELSNGRPVIVGFNGVESSHAAIVAGFKPPEAGEISFIYFILDPSLGPISLDYEALRQGPTSEEFMPWVMTWKNISPRLDGCNERFDPLCGCASQ